MNPNFWITLVGIILAVLGALYSAYGYLDIKVFSTLTETFVFGIVGGIIVGSIVGLLSIFYAVIQIFAEQEPISSFYQDDLLVLVIGILVGVIFGLTVGFMLSRLQEDKISLKRVNLWRRGTFLVSIVFILLCLFDLYIFSLDPFGGILSSIGGLLGFMGLLLGGFAVGVISEQNGITHTGLIARLILGSIGVQILLILSYALTSSIFGDEVWQNIGPDAALNLAVPGFVFSFLFGSRLHQIKIFGPLTQAFMRDKRVLNGTSSSFLRKASWRKFIAWQIIGCCLAISAAAFCNFVLSLIWSSKVVITIGGWLTVGFLIAVIRGEGDKLVARPKPLYRYRLQQNDLRPLINWSRFRYGLGVAFIVCFFWNECLAVYNILFRCLYFGGFGCLTTTSFALNLISSVSVRIIQPVLQYGLSIGSAVGGLYAFVPSLVFEVEHMSERRLGQIGVILTVLGILVAAFPTLISSM